MRLYGSICLSDIPKELIRTSEKNGKKYLNIEVNERREPSAYGNTHYVKATVKAAEKREGVNYYIGDLKPSQFDDRPAETAAMGAPATKENAIMAEINKMVANQKTPPKTYTVDEDLPF